VTLQGQTLFNGSPARQRLPLAQVEVLLLFHPEMQSGGPRRVPPELYARATPGWLTLDVYGRRASSELTGLPVVEDMRLELDGEDIEPMLPDGIVNEVADYILKDA
jgi:hypothetical protein